MKDSALILVNLQNDFLPDGPRAISNSHEIIPIANQLIHQFGFVIATQSWHPKNHSSFNDSLPAHCIQHTEGANFMPGLDTSGIDHVIFKGIETELHSNSAFSDKHPVNKYQIRGTGLHTLLQYRKIKNIFILGLATDHAVKFTAQDALKLGYRPHVIEDACRGFGEQASDALKELSSINIRLVRFEDMQQREGQQSFSFEGE